MKRIDYNPDIFLDIPLDKLPTHVHETKTNYHCPECMQYGCKVKRFYVVYNYDGSPHNWVHTFPCWQMVNEHMMPFLYLNVNVISYGKVIS